MDFEHVEKLKREYTDKYVVVDDERPELRRFKDMTGTVKTVNMKGRALVEFDGHNNRGWYDIDIDFLKVIDEPLPKEEEKKPTPKAKKAPSELEKARSEKGAKEPADAEAKSAPAADQETKPTPASTTESEAPQEAAGEDKAAGDAPA